MGAGSGGGISGISGSGATFRGFTALMAATGLPSTFVPLGFVPLGFARRGFAARALRGFAFAGLRALALPPDFRDARAFAMDAYATVGGVRRQRRTEGPPLEKPRRRPYPPACRASCPISPSPPPIR